jgi:hypothetical protein
VIEARRRTLTVRLETSVTPIVEPERLGEPASELGVRDSVVEVP